MTREELINICEDAIVPVKKWHDRDSNLSQIQLQDIYRGLKANIPFTTKIENDTIWVHFDKPTDEQLSSMNQFYLNIGSRDEYYNWYLNEYQDDDYPEMFDGYGIEWNSGYRGGYLPTRKRLNETKGGDWY